MPPFLYPTAAVTGVKERIDALTVQGDRLYVGTSTGNLQIYSINDATNEATFELIETKKSLVRRSIEQLGFVKDVNSLVVLSEATVTLFPVPTLSPPTPLVKAKAAFSFAINTSVRDVVPDGQPEYSSTATPKPIPTLVTQLMVGCRRKVVIYSWRDGEPQEPKEAALPHSARVITFIDPNTACFVYSPTEYAMFSVSTMTATDITTPVAIPASTSSSAMGALTGLTGYMTLGLGAKPKPAAVQISNTEALISKDAQGFVVGADAKVARNTTIEWSAPPEELAFIKPYIFSVLPAGSVPLLPTSTTSTPAPGGSTQAQTQSTFISTTVVQIRSSISLLTTQNIAFPFNPSEPTPSSSSSSTATSAAPPIPNATVRLLTPSSGKSPLYFVTTPMDKTAAANEGSTIWKCGMLPWAEQIDELVQDGQYADALALLDVIDDAVLPDKEPRRKQIRILNAVSEYREGKFDAAMDTFLELELNPAKVVALYPESIAGRLAVPSERWILLFGGPPAAKGESDPASVVGGEPEKERGGTTPPGTTPAAGVKPLKAAKDEVAAPPSTRGKRGAPDPQRTALETLLRYLSDRRPKLGAALKAVDIVPEDQSHKIAPLSETSVEELFALPNASLSALTPEQLLRCAQIVDTALFKSYLVVRPSLLGSLCRLPNWCEVGEVEEDLRARKKFMDLVDLYQEKKMHEKALQLLRQLGEDEPDLDDKLGSTIRYLQKLGPEYLSQIFESARWVFEVDADKAFEIFTSEAVDLPHAKVSEYLLKIDAKVCIRYLEFVIEQRGEGRVQFHDQLAELYLHMVLGARKRGGEGYQKEMYEKLLHFLDVNELYSVDGLFGRLPDNELHEARAILYRRMGLHQQALELYVYSMKDYLKAEEYCKRVYTPTNDQTRTIFLTLLKLYLRPRPSASASDLLTPALDLIARHNPRLDPVETLQLLPPLVTAGDVRGFLMEALRKGPVLDAAVVRQMGKTQSESVGRRLMVLKERRVKVTDSRICPQCHKRIGNSAFAVHLPRGEVTHLHCREAFKERLHPKSSSTSARRV